MVHLVDLEFSEELRQDNSGSISGGTDNVAQDIYEDLNFDLEIEIQITAEFPENCFENFTNFGSLVFETEGNFVESGYYEESDSGSFPCEVSGVFRSIGIVHN